MKSTTRVLASAAIIFAVASLAPADVVAQCTDCPRCGLQNKHKATAGGSNASGFHELCLTPVGCGGHPPCMTALPWDEQRHEAFDALVDDAQSGDFVATLALLRTFHGQATINVKRQALQVHRLPGCDEETTTDLIAHIPLTPQQFADATAWQARRAAALLADDDHE